VPPVATNSHEARPTENFGIVPWAGAARNLPDAKDVQGNDEAQITQARMRSGELLGVWTAAADTCRWM